MAAETQINVQTIATNGGTVPTFTSADTTNGNKVSVGAGNVIIYVWNNGATGEAVVTFDTPMTVNGLAVAQVILTLAAGAKQMLRLAPPELYAQPSGVDIGTVTFIATSTGAADIDFAVLG